MVVDARNVPSGLPKVWDNTIDEVYAKAPPGVKERVRKGFQAILSRDWAVAKAWFEDALKLDPDNKRLKDMILFCSNPVSPHPARNYVQLPTDADLQLLFDPKDTKPQDFDRYKYYLYAKERAIESNRSVSEVIYVDARLSDIMGEEKDAYKLYQLWEFVSTYIEEGKPFPPTDTTNKKPSKKPTGNQVQLPLNSDIEFLDGPNTAPAKPAVSTKEKQPHN
ncbi:MAG: hypothetical protein AABY50_03285 [Nitrospirota bacterium]